MNDRHVHDADDGQQRRRPIARGGSSNAGRSDITPTYKNNKISSEVSRGSHAQYVPHIGRPQSDPVTSASSVKDAPIGAVAAATAWPILMRQMSPIAPGNRHRRIGKQRHPGARRMHVDDAKGIALLIIRRRECKAGDQAIGDGERRRGTETMASSVAATRYT